MSNYTKATNFTLKDGLSTGDAGKIVKGSEIDAEYTAIASAITSKADLASPTFTGTPAAPTAASGTDSTQLATTAFVQTALQSSYPVGSIYINAAVATNPATLLGFGTWTAFGAGRVLVSLDSGNTNFDTLEETGGTADSIIPSHTHTATSTSTDSGHTHTSVTGRMANSTGSDIGYYSGTQGGASGSFTSTTNSGTASITTTTTIASTGVSVTDKNLQPYITVYMWKRTV